MRIITKAVLAVSMAVMCAGEIVESGTAEEIYYAPRHRYTRELMQALPKLGRRPAESAGGLQTEARPAACAGGPQTEARPAACAGAEGGTRHE